MGNWPEADAALVEANQIVRSPLRVSNQDLR